ncbi:MAG: PAS domain-containing sensor histidine kinase [Betaproteobacteria bacterium]|nr:PAS domain-containing sensor histidine kinase [Betaproteobacteria bacterium]
MGNGVSDDLDRRIASLAAAEAPDANALLKTLLELNDRSQAQQKLLDRVVRISDGYQRAERERGIGYREYYEREVRRIEKIVRISDHYQGMLRSSERRYRDVFDHAPLGFLLFNHQGVIQGWNRAAEDIFGWRRDEVIGKNCLELLVPEADRPRIGELICSTLCDLVPSHSINANLTKSGATIICEWNNVLLYSASGEPEGILSLGSDISERYRLENELRLAKECAERALDDQRQFLAMASHEFRSPLAAVDSAAQLLELQCRGSENGSAPVIRRIRRAVKRLSDFLENCLTEDRLDTEHWSLSGEPFAPADFLRSVIEQMQQQSPNHRLVLRDEKLNGVFTSDPQMLRIMLHNLLGNAVKYSPLGGDVTLAAQQDELGRLHLTVSDQGIGIAPQDRERIFQKYVRAQVGGGIEGAGLGLYLVSRIVALHQGEIGVSSTPGQGTSFKVVLPPMASEIFARDMNLKTAVTRFRQHDFREADTRLTEQFRRGHA